MSRKRVLFVQPSFAPGSGGATVAAWMLSAVVRDFDVTALTWEPIDTAAINAFSGTALSPGDFVVRRPPAAVRRAVDAIAKIDLDPYSIQQWAVMMRFARSMSHRYDVVLSANNEADTGPRSIQYIHYPYLSRSYRDELHDARDSIVSRARARLQRMRPWRLVSGLSFDRIKRQTTLVNSEWTGRVTKATYGIDPITLYPPVPGDFPDVPWEAREDGIVCLGRFVPEKRIEDVIAIVERVRATHPHVRLHLVGVREDHPEQMRYYEEVRRWAEERAAWLTLHEELSRTKMTALVARQRYGLHAMRDEHFGIGVGELVEAGCVVFTPADGGQLEITGGDERLTYRSLDEAAAKIRAALDDAATSESVRGHLATRRALFSAERFMEKLGEVVRNEANLS